MGLVVGLFLLFTVWWGVLEAAAQEKRVALVMGHSGYQHTAVLRNPRADAEDMSAALKRLNFEVVVGIDLDKRAMERIIRQFGLRRELCFVVGLAGQLRRHTAFGRALIVIPADACPIERALAHRARRSGRVHIAI